MIHDPKHGSWYRDAPVPWWKSACIYQVYPASFKDSNADGWGDIPGLISKIDYLQDLGVDCVWLSPCFDSPMEDMGYDVSDYQKVYRSYGTVEDIDQLTQACHERNIKLVLDLVVNHTSSAHPWFQASRSSQASSKRDWYIWRPPRYTENGIRIPPTNWRSYFAGSTWTFDESSQEYYLHLYAPSQPDLNWDNPKVRSAVYEETMRFWLDRGIDGFRIDTVNKYSKDTRFLDVHVTDPSSPYQPAPEMWCNGPNIHTYLREMHQQVLAPYSAVSIGELSNCPSASDVLPYVSASDPQQSMCFQFDLIRLGTGGGFGDKYHYQPFPLSTLKHMTSKWQTFIENTDAWTTVFCENHDNGRAVSRFGDTSTESSWEASAKLLALWQTTLTGTLFLYQGQEIGMRNMPASWSIEDEYRDVESRNFYREAHSDTKDPTRIEKVSQGLRILARDHSRLPMQWDDSCYAGFTDPQSESQPWMRVNDEGLQQCNVATQTGKKGSVLEFYRHMLDLRKRFQDIFVFGTFLLLEPEDEELFAYIKTSEKGGKALVVMNFSKQEQECLDVCAVLGCEVGEAELLVCNLDDCYDEEEQQRRKGVLRPWEGRVYACSAA